MYVFALFVVLCVHSINHVKCMFYSIEYMNKWIYERMDIIYNVDYMFVVTSIYNYKKHISSNLNAFNTHPSMLSSTALY